MISNPIAQKDNSALELLMPIRQLRMLQVEKLEHGPYVYGLIASYRFSSGFTERLGSINVPAFALIKVVPFGAYGVASGNAMT